MPKNLKKESKKLTKTARKEIESGLKAVQENIKKYKKDNNSVTEEQLIADKETLERLLRENKNIDAVKPLEITTAIEAMRKIIPAEYYADRAMFLISSLDSEVAKKLKQKESGNGAVRELSGKITDNLILVANKELDTLLAMPGVAKKVEERRNKIKAENATPSAIPSVLPKRPDALPRPPVLEVPENPLAFDTLRRAKSAFESSKPESPALDASSALPKLKVPSPSPVTRSKIQWNAPTSPQPSEPKSSPKPNKDISLGTLAFQLNLLDKKEKEEKKLEEKQSKGRGRRVAKKDDQLESKDVKEIIATLDDDSSKKRPPKQEDSIDGILNGLEEPKAPNSGEASDNLEDLKESVNTPLKDASREAYNIGDAIVHLTDIVQKIQKDREALANNRAFLKHSPDNKKIEAEIRKIEARWEKYPANFEKLAQLAKQVGMTQEKIDEFEEKAFPSAKKELAKKVEAAGAPENKVESAGKKPKDNSLKGTTRDNRYGRVNSKRLILSFGETAAYRELLDKNLESSKDDADKRSNSREESGVPAGDVDSQPNGLSKILSQKINTKEEMIREIALVRHEQSETDRFIIENDQKIKTFESAIRRKEEEIGALKEATEIERKEAAIKSNKEDLLEYQSQKKNFEKARNGLDKKLKNFVERAKKDFKMTDEEIASIKPSASLMKEDTSILSTSSESGRQSKRDGHSASFDGRREVAADLEKRKSKNIPLDEADALDAFLDAAEEDPEFIQQIDPEFIQQIEQEADLAELDEFVEEYAKEHPENIDKLIGRKSVLRKDDAEFNTLVQELEEKYKKKIKESDNEDIKAGLDKMFGEIEKDVLIARLQAENAKLRKKESEKPPVSSTPPVSHARKSSFINIDDALDDLLEVARTPVSARKQTFPSITITPPPAQPTPVAASPSSPKTEPRDSAVPAQPLTDDLEDLEMQKEAESLKRQLDKLNEKELDLIKAPAPQAVSGSNPKRSSLESSSAPSAPKASVPVQPVDDEELDRLMKSLEKPLNNTSVGDVPSRQSIQQLDTFVDSFAEPKSDPDEDLIKQIIEETESSSRSLDSDAPKSVDNTNPADMEKKLDTLLKKHDDDVEIEGLIEDLQRSNESSSHEAKPQSETDVIDSLTKSLESQKPAGVHVPLGEIPPTPTERFRRDKAKKEVSKENPSSSPKKPSSKKTEDGESKHRKHRKHKRKEAPASEQQPSVPQKTGEQYIVELAALESELKSLKLNRGPQDTNHDDKIESLNHNREELINILRENHGDLLRKHNGESERKDKADKKLLDKITPTAKIIEEVDNLGRKKEEDATALEQRLEESSARSVASPVKNIKKGLRKLSDEVAERERKLEGVLENYAVSSILVGEIGELQDKSRTLLDALVAKQQLLSEDSSKHGKKALIEVNDAIEELSKRKSLELLLPENFAAQDSQLLSLDTESSTKSDEEIEQASKEIDRLFSDHVRLTGELTKKRIFGYATQEEKAALEKQKQNCQKDIKAKIAELLLDSSEKVDNYLANLHDNLTKKVNMTNSADDRKAAEDLFWPKKEELDIAKSSQTTSKSDNESDIVFSEVSVVKASSKTTKKATKHEPSVKRRPVPVAPKEEESRKTPEVASKKESAKARKDDKSPVVSSSVKRGPVPVAPKDEDLRKTPEVTSKKTPAVTPKHDHYAPISRLAQASGQPQTPVLSTSQLETSASPAEETLEKKIGNSSVNKMKESFFGSKKLNASDKTSSQTETKEKEMPKIRTDKGLDESISSDEDGQISDSELDGVDSFVEHEDDNIAPNPTTLPDLSKITADDSLDFSIKRARQNIQANKDNVGRVDAIALDLQTQFCIAFANKVLRPKEGDEFSYSAKFTKSQIDYIREIGQKGGRFEKTKLDEIIDGNKTAKDIYEEMLINIPVVNVSGKIQYSINEGFELELIKAVALEKACPSQSRDEILADLRRSPEESAKLQAERIRTIGATIRNIRQMQGKDPLLNDVENFVICNGLNPQEEARFEAALSEKIVARDLRLREFTRKKMKDKRDNQIDIKDGEAFSGSPSASMSEDRPPQPATPVVDNFNQSNGLPTDRTAKRALGGLLQSSGEDVPVPQDLSGLLGDDFDFGTGQVDSSPRGREDGTVRKAGRKYTDEQKKIFRDNFAKYDVILSEENLRAMGVVPAKGIYSNKDICANINVLFPQTAKKYHIADGVESISILDGFISDLKGEGRDIEAILNAEPLRSASPISSSSEDISDATFPPIPPVTSTPTPEPRRMPIAYSDSFTSLLDGILTPEEKAAIEAQEKAAAEILSKNNKKRTPLDSTIYTKSAPGSSTPVADVIQSQIDALQDIQASFIASKDMKEAYKVSQDIRELLAMQTQQPAKQENSSPKQQPVVNASRLATKDPVVNKGVSKQPSPNPSPFPVALDLSSGRQKTYVNNTRSFAAGIPSRANVPPVQPKKESIHNFIKEFDPKNNGANNTRSFAAGIPSRANVPPVQPKKESIYDFIKEFDPKNNDPRTRK